jgi:group I intron endonuclease
MEYCIYKHTSPSGKSYIGQTKNYEYRSKQHIKTKKCPLFRNAIDKYGWDNFTHEILKSELTIEEANLWEENLIKEHNTLSPNGYNLVNGGLNRKPSEKTLDNMSKASKGRFPSDETREKLSLAQKNRKPISEETRAKMREAQKKNMSSPELRLLLSEKAKNRKPISEETRLKLSLAQKGKVSPAKGRKLTDEQKKKISDASKGRVISIETRRKISEARKGMVNSEETKAKMREAHATRSMEDKNKRAIAISIGLTGGKRSDESKIKMSESAKNRAKISEETKLKMSQSAIKSWEKKKNV